MSPGILQYRKELRETIDDDVLALLDANMAKTLAQSCSDMSIPSSALVMRNCNLTMMWYELCRAVGMYEDRWTGDLERMPLFDFEVTCKPSEKTEYTLGLAAAMAWAESEDAEPDMF